MLLRYGYGWSPAQLGGLLASDKTTLQGHIEGSLGALRRGIGTSAESTGNVEEQLRAYAELLDREAPPVPAVTGELADPQPAWMDSRRRVLPALVIGTVGVLAAVGALAVGTGSGPTSTSLSVDTSASDIPGVAVSLVNPSAVGPESFDWEPAFVGPGGVVEVGGTLHMLASTQGDGLASIGHATSPDGAVWTVATPGPVLDLSAASWAPLEFDFAAARSLVVVDGLWQLFFDVRWLDPVSDEFRSSIGRATAPAAQGPWTIDEVPALRPNPDHPWFSSAVSSPSVVPTSDGLAMLFVGQGDGAGSAVGVAMSNDGVTWRARSEPVFVAGDGWERGSIGTVDAIPIDGGYVALYSGSGTNQRGLALSSNLFDWVPHPANPILSPQDVPGSAVFDSEFVAVDSNLYGYIESGAVRAGGEVVVVRIDADFAALAAALVGPG